MFSLMGKCMSCLRRKTQPKREITLAILGLDDAGKTTATKALIGEPLETAPTVGFVSENVYLDHYHIKIFDLGGGKRIRNIWTQYLNEVYGIIYVIDSSNHETIEETKATLKELLGQDKVSGKPLLVLANKQDRENAMDEVDICEKLSLEDMVNANKCPCRIETCSAIKGTGKKIDTNIKTGLKWICATLDHNWSVYHPRVDKDMNEEAERRKKELEEKRERVRKIREEREKKEEEERLRLGIEKPASDEEDMIDGDPFKRVDVNTLNEKEKKMKEEKKRRKELELRMSGRDTNENNLSNNEEESGGEIKSSRSIGYLRLQPGLGNNDSLLHNGNLNRNNKLTDDSDQDSDVGVNTKRQRRATPRLPPLQKPLGTKFANDEQKHGKKKKKKKKLKALQENEEEVENMGDSYHPSKHSVQSVSKVIVSTGDSNPDMQNQNQNNLYNGYNASKHIVIGKTLSLDNETEDDITPQSLKVKKKKKSKGSHRSFDGFPTTPRSPEVDDSDSYLSTNIDNEDTKTGSTQVRKLKKKAYIKNNKTGPSDEDEIEMTETLRGSNITDFSWTVGTPKKEKRSSDEEISGRNWGFAEDLGSTIDSPPRRISVRPNCDDEDVIL